MLNQVCISSMFPFIYAVSLVNEQPSYHAVILGSHFCFWFFYMFHNICNNVSKKKSNSVL